MSSPKHLPASLGYHGSIVNAESGKEKRYEIHDLSMENHSNWRGKKRNKERERAFTSHLWQKAGLHAPGTSSPSFPVTSYYLQRGRGTVSLLLAISPQSGCTPHVH